MVAATATDQPRIDLENIIGAIVGARGLLRVLDVRIERRMRTADEADDLAMVREVVMLLNEARDGLAEWHPQGRNKEH